MINFEDLKEIKEVLALRLKAKMPSMSIDLYMGGLLQIFNDLNMSMVDFDSECMKATCPIKMKGSKDLKALSNNLDNFVGIKLLVKYI